MVIVRVLAAIGANYIFKEINKELEPKGYLDWGCKVFR